MHELAVTQSIVEQIAEKTHGIQVTEVRLEIGELAGIVTDSVRFCFELVTEGTPLEGAALRIDEPPGRGWCSTCDRSFGLRDLVLVCPCGSTDVRVVDGEQLLIRSVEVV
jgi:hydrogenase nickel incorporation protein HypA/HybF